MAVDAADLLSGLDHPGRTLPIAPRFTLLACSWHTEIIDSMLLVDCRVRARVGGTPSRSTLSVSSSPSRRLAAAPGWARSNLLGEGEQRGLGFQRRSGVVGEPVGTESGRNDRSQTQVERAVVQAESTPRPPSGVGTSAQVNSRLDCARPVRPCYPRRERTGRAQSVDVAYPGLVAAVVASAEKMGGSPAEGGAAEFHGAPFSRDCRCVRSSPTRSDPTLTIISQYSAVGSES